MLLSVETKAAALLVIQPLEVPGSPASSPDHDRHEKTMNAHVALLRSRTQVSARPSRRVPRWRTDNRPSRPKLPHSHARAAVGDEAGEQPAHDRDDERAQERGPEAGDGEAGH